MWLVEILLKRSKAAHFPARFSQLLPRLRFLEIPVSTAKAWATTRATITRPTSRCAVTEVTLTETTNRKISTNYINLTHLTKNFIINVIRVTDNIDKVINIAKKPVRFLMCILTCMYHVNWTGTRRTRMHIKVHEYKLTERTIEHKIDLLSSISERHVGFFRFLAAKWSIKERLNTWDVSDGSG